MGSPLQEITSPLRPFLGICGMIAFSGYDGFLYSIGYLAGWIVALFVVAEPLKRLGKFTFADALDSRFGSKGIRLMAGISTLVVSIFLPHSLKW
jgi:cation/acetate symporter